MASNSEYEQRRSFETSEERFSRSYNKMLNEWVEKLVEVRLNPPTFNIDKSCILIKRVTIIEPNTEGYLKECLSRYEQENLKTK